MAKKIPYIIICAVFAFSSCNRNEVIERVPPSIVFDNGTGVYETKIKRGITITPVVSNASAAEFTWTMEGRVVGREARYDFESATPGEYFITFGVKTASGTAHEDIRIDVLELMPPRVSLPVTDGGYIPAVAGRELKLDPVVASFDEVEYLWTVAGAEAEVSTEKSIVFKEDTAGDYDVSLTATNEDGTTVVEVVVRVDEEPGVTLLFVAEEMSVPLGKTLCVAPLVREAKGGVTYEWYVDGECRRGDGRFFDFTPASQGSYEVRVAAHDGATSGEATVTVLCVAPERTYYRPAGGDASEYATGVYEFTPAPGQFVNRGYTAATPVEACAYAQEQLAAGDRYISLGGFGGYIVVGFDHSVDNTGDSDFAVYGNAFAGSSEPGIVWVMQDENGDGLPNDTWYELKGSETGKTATLQDYEVTYYKPSAAKMAVMWSDSEGNTGTVDYLGVQQSQQSYYPEWITAKSYTLRGTCLGVRNVQDSGSGLWQNKGYDWGYADNFGTDRDPDNPNPTGGVSPNYFKISNAIRADGKPAGFEYIDFVKVQTGVNAKSGALGEVSTEVMGFRDLNMPGRR